MTPASGETFPTPETDQQAVLRLLHEKMDQRDWHEGYPEVSWLGNGTRQDVKMTYGAGLEGPTFSETRTLQLRRRKVVAEIGHSLSIDWYVGLDAEGRDYVLGTTFRIDVPTGTLQVYQHQGRNDYMNSRAQAYAHFGIDDAAPEDQWAQLRELVEAWPS